MIATIETDLRRISYISSARSSLTKDDLDAILDASRRQNEAAGITGLLLYHDGNFFQAMEGGFEHAERTFARIRRDNRHRGIIVLESHAVPERLFRRWSMAFRPIDELTSRQKQDFIGFSQVSAHFSEAAKSGEGTATLIESFLKSFRDLT
jgi:hypothetical protein